MSEFAELGAPVRARLDAKHQAREAALRLSRASIRASANAIRAAHRAERARAAELLDEAGTALGKALTACAEEPEIRWAGFVADAEKEFAEARTTFAVLGGEPPPTPEQVGVTDASWLNGLAETVGEIRRHLLDGLRAGQLDRCEELLGVMDDIYALLVTIDFPDGVTGGLRRSTDIARSIIERTRGDFTTALLQDRLRDALQAHRDVLDR